MTEYERGAVSQQVTLNDLLAVIERLEQAIEKLHRELMATPALPPYSAPTPTYYTTHTGTGTKEVNLHAFYE